VLPSLNGTLPPGSRPGFLFAGCFGLAVVLRGPLFLFCPSLFPSPSCAVYFCDTCHSQHPPPAGSDFVGLVLARVLFCRYDFLLNSVRTLPQDKTIGNPLER